MTNELTINADNINQSSRHIIYGIGRAPCKHNRHCMKSLAAHAQMTAPPGCTPASNVTSARDASISLVGANWFQFVRGRPTRPQQHGREMPFKRPPWEHCCLEDVICETGSARRVPTSMRTPADSTTDLGGASGAHGDSV